MGRTIVEEFISGVIDLIFGGVMWWSIVLFVLCACWTYRLWKTFGTGNSLFPEIAKNSFIFSSVIGIFAFACLVTVQFIAHSYVQGRQQQEAEQKKQQEEAKRKSEDIIRAWLDRGQFSVRVLVPKSSDNFALQATRGEMQFDVFQRKDANDVLRIQFAVIPDKLFAETFAKTSEQIQARYFNEMKIELIRFGVQLSIDRSIPSIFVFNDVPFDKSMKRTDFMKSVFDLQRSAALIKILNTKLLDGGYSGKN